MGRSTVYSGYTLFPDALIPISKAACAETTRQNKTKSRIIQPEGEKRLII